MMVSKKTKNRIFKRSFKLSVFLDEFNQALISSSDVHHLALAIMLVLDKFIQPEFSSFTLRDANFKITVDSRQQKSEAKAMPKIPRGVAEYHFLEDSRIINRVALSSKHKKLRQILLKKNIVIALDLTDLSRSNSNNKKSFNDLHFATLALGPKQNGSKYTKKDLEALKVVSKELVIALQNSLRFEEIKSFNAKLQRKIDDATRKLKMQNKKLMETDELKDDFLSIASHQMRTPLSAINGYASMLISGDAGKLNEQQDKFTGTIQHNTRKLSYLINDFLNISRLKSGKFQIDKKPTELASVLQSEVKNIKKQFKDKKITFKINTIAELPAVKIDEQKIRQVI